MAVDAKEIIRQIDEVLDRAVRLIPVLPDPDAYRRAYHEVMEVAALAQYTVQRLTTEGDTWRQQSDSAMGRHGLSKPDNVITTHIAILKAMKFAYEKGHLDTIAVLIHAALFTDFLEMAVYLLGEGFKDPAAMLTGGVLEEHLRKLGAKHAIPGTFTNTQGDIKHKMINQLNLELYGKGVYAKPEMMQVQAWGAIRNSADHGKFGEYTKEQVEAMQQGLLSFIGRYPA